MTRVWRYEWFGGLVIATVEHWGTDMYWAFVQSAQGRVDFHNEKGGILFATQGQAIEACLSYLHRHGINTDEVIQ